MDATVQLLLSSLAVGAIYGTIGIAFVMVHKMTGMVNFAQGDIAVAGAFAAVVASAYVPPLVAILIGGVAGGIVSVIMYALALHPLRKRSLLVQTIVTLGVGIAIRSILQLIFGTTPYQFAPVNPGGPLVILGGVVSYQALWILGIALLSFIGLTLFLTRTMTGRALSACAINPYAAGVVGINLTLMAVIAFALSGLVAGAVVAAEAPSSFITVSAGFALGLKGFVAAILGGFEKLGLTLIGGFLIALVEVFAGVWISTTYASAIVFGLLIVMLIVRPQGLSRKLVTERV